jgi:hypothetical protein
MTTIPVTKPKHPMSGYNLFVSLYLATVEIGQSPYKLPDGTQFSGTYIKLEDGTYLLQEIGSKLKLES